MRVFLSVYVPSVAAFDFVLICSVKFWDLLFLTTLLLGDVVGGGGGRDVCDRGHECDGV